MKNPPLISVIIPVYNTQDFVGECLQSVYSQRKENFTVEAVVIDDGSSDNSLNIINNFIAENAIKTWKVKSTVNRGLSSARNTGLDISSGDYIYFLDSDDYLDSDALLRLFQIADQDKADLVIARTVNFNSGGQIEHYTDYQFTEKKEVSIIKNPEILEIISACSKLYNRQLIDSVRFPDKLVHEDNYFSLLIFDKSETIVLCPESRYLRRIREDENNKSITQMLGVKTFKDFFKNYSLLLPLVSLQNKERIFNTSYINIDLYITKKINESQRRVCYQFTLKQLLIQIVKDKKNYLIYSIMWLKIFRSWCHIILKTLGVRT